MSKSFWAEGLVDLERYPIENLENPVTQELIASFRERFQKNGALEIENFLTPAGVERLVAESVSIENAAHHNAMVGNAYLDEPESSLPADHTRKMMEPTALGAIGYDQIPSDHLLRKIYEWDALMNFIGEIVGIKPMYRYADPMGALNLAVMKDGDYLRWHFDQTDFVTSLSVRNADEGGEFEYVPMIRNQQEEHYDRVRAVIQGSREGVVKIANKPGTLVLFKGRYSLHRVTPIKGAKSRLMGLFGFDSRPGVMSSDYLRRIRYGRTESTVSV